MIAGTIAHVLQSQPHSSAVAGSGTCPCDLASCRAVTRTITLVQQDYTRRATDRTLQRQKLKRTSDCGSRACEKASIETPEQALNFSVDWVLSPLQHHNSCLDETVQKSPCASAHAHAHARARAPARLPARPPARTPARTHTHIGPCRKSKVPFKAVI